MYFGGESFRTSVVVYLFGAYLKLGTGNPCDAQDNTNDDPTGLDKVVCLCSLENVGPILPIGSKEMNADN